MTCNINQATRAPSVFALFGILCFQSSDLGHISGVGRVEVGRAGLLRSPIPYFYSSNFQEPSIKPTQVEPEADTIIVSCDGAIKRNRKVERRNVCTFLCWCGKHWPESKSLTKSQGKVLEEILSQNYSRFSTAMRKKKKSVKCRLQPNCFTSLLKSSSPYWKVLN